MTLLTHELQKRRSGFRLIASKSSLKAKKAGYGRATIRKKKENHKSWLQYVTEQSWEPELLISGLAIYATLQLPGLFRDAYQYYEYNLQVSSGVFDEMLPLLIYGVFTTVSYILLAAFIIHFVVRAFWIGFIGLMSVYKDSIKYEDLPYSDYYKEQARKKLGTIEQMALKLDQLSSLIFSCIYGDTDERNTHHSGCQHF